MRALCCRHSMVVCHFVPLSCVPPVYNDMQVAEVGLNERYVCHGTHGLPCTGCDCYKARAAGYGS